MSRPKPKTIRKIELMYRVFGKCEGHTCGECNNFCSGRYHDKIVRKCEVYGLTHSEASDWAKRWTACGKFNQEYTGRPIIEMVKHNSSKPKEPEPPLEGQVFLEGTEIA